MAEQREWSLCLDVEDQIRNPTETWKENKNWQWEGKTKEKVNIWFESVNYNNLKIIEDFNLLNFWENDV